MSYKTIRLSAIDSLFFRESRPMEAMGELQSIFPPSMNTLSGVIRNWIGEQNKVNWHDFTTQDNHPLRRLIGSPDQLDDLGQLSFKGAWLRKAEERYFPTPLHLMQKDNDIFQLQLSTKRHYCDLGKKVRLPELEESAKGSKSLENTWVSAAIFQKILQGKLPESKDFLTEDSFFERQSRLGIARNNKTRTVEKGMLYQTQHIRPKNDVAIEVDIKGLPNDALENSIIRLGGEARPAYLTLKDYQPYLAEIPSQDTTNAQGIMIYLLTPLLLKDKAWSLPDFKKIEKDDSTYWQGELNGVALTLESSVTGKALREGGWDMAKHRPRTMKSLLPAGSVFYCTPQNNTIADAIKALHNTQIGERQHYGYGHIAVGIWK